MGIERVGSIYAITDGIPGYSNAGVGEVFHVVKIEKEYIQKGIELLEKEVENICKREKKTANKLRKRKAKGEFSNKPETKVMVF